MRIAILGGDTMIGRGVRGSFRHESEGDGELCDSTHYLHMALHFDAPADETTRDLEIENIRERNKDGCYLWGDYVNMKFDIPPDVRLMSLETAVTSSINNDDIPWVKGIQYHCHTANIPEIFSAFGHTNHGGNNPIPYVITLANNHSMDLGRKAFEKETLPTLAALPCLGNIVGGGMNIHDAVKPVKIQREQGVVEIFAFSTECAGTPEDWCANESKSGMVVLPFLASDMAVNDAFSIISKFITTPKCADTARVLSIHWGPNWAYRDGLDDGQEFRRKLAHRMVDELEVDLVYGHSSHHIRGLEVYNKRLIMYGAGDFIDDHEGFKKIGDQEQNEYSTLGAVFLVDLKTSGHLQKLTLIPTFVDRLQLIQVPNHEVDKWNPWTQKMEKKRDLAKDLMYHVNTLSERDSNNEGYVTLRVVENDDSIPGGPILVYP